MKPLFQVWQDFTADYRTASHVLLLADYDGTITPIAGRPEDAVLAPAVRDLLSALAEKTTFSVGVISGRQLAEIKSMVGIEDIFYAGNHGLEIEGPGIKYINLQAESSRKTINNLAGQIAVELADTDGVIIQDKGLSLSVHYRLVKKEKESLVADTIHRLADPLITGGKITLFTGKKVWEVRPPIDWNKGKAVETIADKLKSTLKQKRLLAIFLGDDITDEDAFRVVRRPEGWGIYVGEENRASAAEYYLNSPAEVAEFLKRLNELKL